MEKTLLQRWWTRAFIILAVATFLGMAQATYSYHQYEGFRKERPTMPAATFWPIAVLGVVDWYAWGLLIPLIVWLGRRFSFEQFSVLRLLLHVLAGIFLSVVVLAFTVPFVKHLPFTCNTTASRLDYLTLFNQRIGSLIYYVLIYWLILGISEAVRYYVKFRERELRASQLQEELTRSQLQVLKMQLQPHFLFNTLHAISALMHKNVHLADRMIARLGELLRTVLENAGAQEVTLREEIEFVETYLEIEQARLGPRLNVTIDVPTAIMDAAVPNLLLQPIVENAVIHGIAPLAYPGEITILARKEGDQLRLEVADTGPGISGETSSKKQGYGLNNTRARLVHLYGSNHQFELSNKFHKGLAVIVRLPYRQIDSDQVISIASGPYLPSTERIGEPHPSPHR